MRIREKLVLIMVVPILLSILVIAVLILFSVHDQKRTDEEDLLNRVSLEVFELSLLVNDAALYPAGTRARKQWAVKYDHISELVGQIERKGLMEPARIGRLQNQLHFLGEGYQRLIDLIETPGLDSDLKQVRRNRLVGQLGVSAQALSTSASSMARSMQAQIQRRQLRQDISVAVLVVSEAILLAIISFMVARSVLTPLQHLHEGTRRIGAGDLDHKVGSHARDEIGDLGKAFDAMTSSLKLVTASREELRQEIEARQRAEARETRLGRILDSSSNEIYVFDAETLHFVDVNEGARNNLGYSMEELHDLTPLALKPAYTSERFAELVQPLRDQQKETVLFETYHRRKDASTYPVEIRLQLMEQERQSVFVAVIQDITERKVAEDAMVNLTFRLKTSNKELQDFAYVVSHDLQEPLRMVSSYLQLLQQRYSEKLGQDADEFIGFAVDGSRRMSGMINGLLEYARVETQGNAFAAVALESLLDNVLSNLALQISEADASVQRQPLPEVEGDASQLERLLQNLVANALKFHGQQPPSIVIEVQQDQRQWIISVRDHGIGIDAKDAERIFGMFQRLHSNKEYPGSGIGLAICKRIVERHGGRIWVESAAGEGSSFRFALPVIEDMEMEDDNS